MKIRTDFVTNSSSSSFVCVNINNGPLSEKGYDSVFDLLSYLFLDDGLYVDFNKSLSASLIDILEAGIDRDGDDFCEGWNDYASKVVEFLQKNGSAIDDETEAEIVVGVSNGEDGYAHYQKLVYQNGQGQLVSWPDYERFGCSSISDFNSKFFHGEIKELNNSKYDVIFELIFDEDELENAVEKTGKSESFKVTKELFENVYGDEEDDDYEEDET